MSNTIINVKKNYLMSITNYSNSQIIILVLFFIFYQEEQNIRSNGGNKRKMPPHPIRIAKTIDVIARITFPTAYAVFLIFFFIHYTSHPSHWSQ